MVEGLREREPEDQFVRGIHHLNCVVARMGQLVCHLGRLSPCQATVSPTSAEGSGEGTGFGMASAAAI